MLYPFYDTKKLFTIIYLKPWNRTIMCNFNIQGYYQFQFISSRFNRPGHRAVYMQVNGLLLPHWPFDGCNQMDGGSLPSDNRCLGSSISWIDTSDVSAKIVRDPFFKITGESSCYVKDLWFYANKYPVTLQPTFVSYTGILPSVVDLSGRVLRTYVPLSPFF